MEKLTEADGRRALADHVREKAGAARVKYGGKVDYATMLAMLDDRAVVRYPTRVRFDAAPLQSGEFAFAQPLGDHPVAGFELVIHPQFENRPDVLPQLMAYHLVTVNYGEIAGCDEAELFGATLLGLEIEPYYESLCALADSLPAG